MIKLETMLTENFKNDSKACLMAYIDPTYGPRIAATGQRIIPPQNLYVDPEDSSFGYESDPHVTIKYGFEPDLMKQDILNILQGIKPFFMNIIGLNQFKSDKYDVVKFEVKKCPILTELRRKCDSFPNVDKYPNYQPHMTLAYVKKGSFPHIREGLNIRLPITRFKYSGPKSSYFVGL